MEDEVSTCRQFIDKLGISDITLRNDNSAVRERLRLARRLCPTKELSLYAHDPHSDPPALLYQ